MSSKLWLSAQHEKTDEDYHIMKGQVHGTSIMVAEVDFPSVLADFELKAEEILGNQKFAGTIVASDDGETWSFPVEEGLGVDEPLGLGDLQHKLDTAYDLVDEVVGDMRSRGWDGLAERTHRLYEALYVDAVETIEHEQAILSSTKRG